jgi:preprotein translocase subunit SecF
VPFEIVPHGTQFDFIGKRRIGFAISALLLIGAAIAIPVQGIRLGIDFAGGTEVQLLFADGADVDEGRIRTVASACGVTEASVVRYGETDSAEFLVRFRAAEDGVLPEGVDCPLPEGVAERLAAIDRDIGADLENPGTAALIDRLVAALGHTLGALEVQRVEYVGPRVGAELRRDGLLSIGIACVMILGYVAFRFSARFAPGAVIALLHDVGITAGIFVIFGLEFDLRVLAALLATLGYSLNDTIIIYDRIRENMALRTKHDLVDVLNRSVNQTLSRTVLTSLTTLGAVGALLVTGGEVIRPFALAMAIGILAGTYSSMFIAAPTLLFLETRFGDGTGDTSSGGARKGGGTPPKPKSGSKRGSGKSRGKAARASA